MCRADYIVRWATALSVTNPQNILFFCQFNISLHITRSNCKGVTPTAHHEAPPSLTVALHNNVLILKVPATKPVAPPRPRPAVRITAMVTPTPRQVKLAETWKGNVIARDVGARLLLVPRLRALARGHEVNCMLWPNINIEEIQLMISDRQHLQVLPGFMKDLLHRGIEPGFGFFHL